MTALLEAGAVPDTVADDGLPVLCLAVAAYDTAVAWALVEGGADPDRKLPDGTTPLIRAIEGGSPAVAQAVLGREPRLRLPEAEREQLLRTSVPRSLTSCSAGTPLPVLSARQLAPRCWCSPGTRTGQ
ncbi:ankyrin repeat domain-containing protein [Streptomyces exfoliatus]|uniref:ankyrin repeat domain-containing protein n=1 Tax=Streptomyces exfoliatus TaxID=1905 RepID=UPI001F52A8E6|nr:ankyrin repeat domain-containing protein [Streptomyces exfoliatus]